MQHFIQKRTETQYGLDLKSSDLNRNPRFASLMKNAQYHSSGAPEKRLGWQRHSNPTDGFGLFSYKYVDASDDFQELPISIGQQLTKMAFTTITVSYSGATPSVVLSLYFDIVADQYKCTLVAGENTLLDFSLGLGFDEVTPIAVSDLATAINAVTGMTAVVTGDSTAPAAFLKIIRDVDVKSMAWSGKAVGWTTCNSPITNPFDGSYTRRNNVDFENVSAVNLNNVMYISNGYDNLMKFDGQNVYRAGMPKPASISPADAAVGAISGSNYIWKAGYIQKDNVGNEVAGNVLFATVVASIVNRQYDITVANIQASTGFNTGCAIVAGAQAVVTTITVDDGSGGAHTMKVGDTAYFYNGVTSSYVERVITAIAATTITITGAAVTVADNAVISNNLKIQIQRNKTSATTPTVFYEVIQIPNNSFVATQIYRDNLADASLGALVEPPASDRSLPPKGKYIAAFQNLLFITGIPGDNDRVQWSDLDGPEYFPSDTNQDKVSTTISGQNVGIAANGPVLAVFKKTSTVIGSGTFWDNNYRFEEKAPNIGCSSHASLVQAEGILAWWSDRGPYRMIGGQIPEPIGANEDGESRISPVMNQPGYQGNSYLSEQFYRAQRVVGINWLSSKKLLFYLPCESLVTTDRYQNENSKVYAYDYTRDAWLEWDNIDMVAGAIVYQDELYFKGRRRNSLNAVVSNLDRMMNLNDAYDYQDNHEPIEWEYGPQWENLGEPDIIKKFLKIRIYSLVDIQNNQFTVTVRQEINLQKDVIIAEFEISVTGVGYGQSAYGTDPYGSATQDSFSHDLARARTKSIRTRFYNNEPQQNCLISAWTYECAAPFKQEFKE